MSGASCPEGYQLISLTDEKIDQFMTFLIEITEGPAEAIALLHAGIAQVDSMNGARSAHQLGQELTFDLIAGGHRES